MKSKWEESGDNKWIRKYGPFEVRVYRSTVNENYVAISDYVELDVGVSFGELGDAYDVDCDKAALAIIDKQIKKNIRSWAK